MYQLCCTGRLNLLLLGLCATVAAACFTVSPAYHSRQEHECLIDFIAVSPDARGKGVGALLMRWAEQTGAAILAETEADAVAAHGVDMSLWVSNRACKPLTVMHAACSAVPI